ncbi:Solute carrier family 35 member F2 [Liparis tanakae]|uniref:Solute carrier family 35 member F2 n=1 Tax=Liparis tanakae TaxID=230148 RepID=A0A4Z2IIY6_9TELE|nr:Solute carrier family 35 member F2 [Liparis tanakae]
MATKQSEDDAPGDVSDESRSTGLMMRVRNFKPKEVFTWRLAKTLAMGQGLAVLICGTAITSQYLATSFHVNTPMLQSFFNYALLCVTYTPVLFCRTGDGNILQILKRRWWKYLLLGLVDVEANYAMVKAYQYTTITTSNILLGDGLVLLGASLYAVSNVCQEYTVKNLSRVEFLGMVGLFGTVISTVQMVILERNEVANIQWSWQVGLLFSAYAVCMYTLYSCMPIVVKLSSATAVNLSLLTADLFSLFCGIVLFQYNFTGLYLVSLVVILIGFIAFNSVPTPTDLAEPAASPSSICEEGYDPAAVPKDLTNREVAVNITAEEEEQQECGETEEGLEEKQRRRGKKKRASQSLGRGSGDKDVVAVGRSTKM